jgi:cell division protein FtsA
LLDDLKTPEFATSIGLILYANGENNKYEKDSNQNFHSLNLSETKEQENLLFKTEETEQKEEKEILAEIPKKTKNKTNPIKKFINWVNNLF